MAKRVLSDQFDDAVEAMMADPAAPPALSGKLAALLQIAGDLRHLPRADFRARLRKELELNREDATSVSSHVRPGFSSLTPYLQVRGADAFIEFLQQAFDGQLRKRVPTPSGSVQHAEIRVGDSIVETADATHEFGPMPTAIHLYVPDADEVFARALRAGASVVHEMTDQPYGDREGGVRDPFGNSWYIATHTAAGSTTHVPAGLRSVTPYLHPQSGAEVIDFLRRAFDAEEALRIEGPAGSVVHAKIRVGDSTLEMGEAHGPYQPLPTALHLYVRDADAAFRKALAAGARPLFEPADQDYGDRVGGVTDPFGNSWYLATYIGAKHSATQAEEPIVATARTGGYHSVTPFLLVRDVGEVVEFLSAAFAAKEISRDRGGDPPHDHAEVQVGDSVLMVGEAVGGFTPMPASHYLLVHDAAAAFWDAVRAGATPIQEARDMPWGDRMASVKDPAGNIWFLAQQKKT